MLNQLPIIVWYKKGNLAMSTHYTPIFLLLGVCLITVASETRGEENRRIPVVVTVQANIKNVKVGDSIPLAITVSNGLSFSIEYSTFSLTPNDWNGETFNVSLVDIYRDGTLGNLYLARPEIKAPIPVQGTSRKEIEPGGKLVIITDAQKWKLCDGWLPGKYKVTVRVDSLKVDKYSSLSVISDPFEFDVK